MNDPQASGSPSPVLEAGTSDSPSPAAHPSVADAGAGRAGATEARPSFIFFGVTAAISLVADIGTKVWAEITLLHRSSHPIVLIEDHLQLTLAYNPGGAWGLLQDASEQLRKPFFVLVSMAAILFIVSLYGRLMPGQRALKWGLPLFWGGALGNLADRITRSQVIDFIDYRADWIRWMNEQIASVVGTWSVTDHWPTFNVADIAICVGVGLMAVDMFTSRRGPIEADEPAPLTQKSVAPEAPEAPEYSKGATGALSDAPER